MARNGIGQEKVPGVVEQATDKAVLVRDEGTGNEIWIPRRVCIRGDALSIGDEEIYVAKWWLDEVQS